MTLVGAVISIIALFLSFTSVSMFGEKVSSSLFQQGAVGWYRRRRVRGFVVLGLARPLGFVWIHGSNPFWVGCA